MHVVCWVVTVYLLITSTVAFHPLRFMATDGLAWMVGWPAAELAGPAFTVEAAVALLTWWHHWPHGIPGVVLLTLVCIVLLENFVLTFVVVAGFGLTRRALLRHEIPLDIKDVRPRYVTTVRNLFVAPVRPRDVTVSRDVHYGPHRAHRLDVYRLATTPLHAPVVLYFHGGGWVWGTKREQGRPVLFELARQGFVVVSADYRLSPQHKWPEHIEDAMRALAWVKSTISSYGGDPDRVVLSGNSAGGQLCALVALTSESREFLPDDAPQPADLSVRGCAPYYGVLEMTGDEQAWRGHGRALRIMLEQLVFPHRFEHDEHTFRLASPIERITPSAPPFLLVHGTNDTLVDVRVARAFVEQFKRRAPGVPLWYVELPLAQHAFDQSLSPRTAAISRAVVAFARHVTSTPSPTRHRLSAAQHAAYQVPPTQLHVEGFSSPFAAAQSMGDYIVVTAANPAARVDSALTDEQNESLRVALESEMRWRGQSFLATRAQAPDGSWVEAGVALPSYSLDDAHRLAQRYGQLAFYRVTPTAIEVIATKG